MSLKITVKWWYLLVLLVFLLSSLGIVWPTWSSVGSSASSSRLEQSQVIIEKSNLKPFCDVDTCCDIFWFGLTNDRAQSYYLTMNVNNPAKSTNSGKWQPDLPIRGWYLVEAYIPSHGMIDWTCPNYSFHVGSDTSQARYTITHALGSSLVSGNQAVYSGGWLPLGTFLFNQGNTGLVSLVDLNDEANLSKTVSFSAMRFTLVSTQTYNMDFPIIFFSPTPKPTPLPQTGGVVVLTKQAFDKCNIASVNDMQVWWKDSPYWVTNLYIGGNSRSCSNTELTSTWVNSVHQQGWAFIATWVGPQAPCTSFPNRFSADAYTAYFQGRSEAEAAVTKASSLGLVSQGWPGTILYYDMEGYASSSTPDCRNAVNSFTNGWVGRLHELGHKAGMYGAACSYMYDWAAISNVPDDVWIASAYSGQYDPNANVWDVACLSRNLWANHQRIRQYSWGHYETWGGIRLHIDSDITDGEVTSPTVTLSMASIDAINQISSLPSRSLADFQLVASGQGWILVEGRLYWTTDEGVSWKEVTPNNSPIKDAYFMDTQEGWALAAGEDKMNQDFARIYHTSNGGDTWEPFPINLPSEYGSVFLEFLDTQTGWLSVKLPSSSNFSLGNLYRTRDGGRTWQSFSLPIGEPVHFVDRDTGWVAGGAGGNELYLTQDGGMTWTRVPIIPRAEDIPGKVSIDLPVFQGRNCGMITVRYLDANQPRLEIFRSIDGGFSWNLAYTIPMNSSTVLGTSSVPSDHQPELGVIADYTNQKIGVISSSGEVHSRSAVLPPGLKGVQIASDQTGWAWTEQNTCIGIKSSPSQTFTCTKRSGLWLTKDGGGSWATINLPNP